MGVVEGYRNQRKHLEPQHSRCERWWDIWETVSTKKCQQLPLSYLEEIIMLVT